MAEIALSRGLVALVDDDDADVLSACSWHVSETEHGGLYAQARIPGTGRRAYMHRVITGAPKGLQVHHKNGNTLDNRRENLEVLSPARHQAEHHHREPSGVHPFRGRYRAQSRIDGVHYSLGVYDARDAALRAVEIARSTLPGTPPEQRKTAVRRIVTVARRYQPNPVPGI